MPEHRKSPQAMHAIISHADYAVIGDLNVVIPALVAALRARPGGGMPTA
jgi:hypothetical protein